MFVFRFIYRIPHRASVRQGFVVASSRDDAQVRAGCVAGGESGDLLLVERFASALQLEALRECGVWQQLSHDDRLLLLHCGMETARQTIAQIQRETVSRP